MITKPFGTGGIDYEELSETLTLSESTNELSECFNIDILQDGALEQIETFMVTVTTDDTNITVQGSPAFIVILNSDGMCLYIV